MRLFDLTHPLGPETPVFPGDEPVRARTNATLDADGFRTTRLELGTHSGTHVDAPAHLLPNGSTIDTLPLELWVGPAVLLDAGDLGGPPLGAERLLLAGCPDGLTLTWARALAASGVRLVGVEGPSVDLVDSRDLPCHRALLGAGVALVENLRLAGVPRGEGTLYCLPLAVGAGDGAPARVLWEPREGAAGS
ncbi:MAG: cyclase family protein [Deferrisomatales bacterium]|nr:cyclase family protein [Deferrisomatales bacterium]